MDIQDFINSFKDQFDDPSIDLSPETNFKELDDWSSLVALSLICMVEEEFGKTINGDTIRKATTVQDLFDDITK